MGRCGFVAAAVGLITLIGFARLRTANIRADQVVALNKLKVESMENSLPKLVREMIDYYAEQKLNPVFDSFVKKATLKDQMTMKMDIALFHEYVKKQQQAEAVNDE